MISSLHRFQDGNQTAVLVGWEPNKTSQDEMLLLRQAAAQVNRRLVTLALNFPPYPDRPLPRHKIPIKSWGYMHMADWFFRRLFFEVPELGQVEYLLRLDSDACLRGEMPNMFAYMDVHPETAYLANSMLLTYPDCGQPVAGLVDLAMNFTRTHNLPLRRDELTAFARRKSYAYRKLECVLGYSTNLELIRLRPFRESTTFSAWADAVAAANGVYLYRWGDAPLRRLSLEMMNYSLGRGVEILQRLGPKIDGRDLAKVYYHPVKAGNC